MNWLYFGSITLCGLLSLSDYIKTLKPYKLIYVLFWAYIFIGTPIVEKITSNSIIGLLHMVLGLIPMLIFIYWDVMKTNKEK